MSEVKDAVPRGFTRYYVLYLLSKNSLSGKEIIDAASGDPSLHWKPSPGLIYPMLGRLLEEGYIEESDGKYKITEKGKVKLADYYKYQAHLIEKMSVLEEFAAKIASTNLFLTSEVMDTVASGVAEVKNTVRPNYSLKRLKEKYRDFLRSELERIDRELGESNNSNKQEGTPNP
ncbi:MAG: PadR family transcriptional regulator [Thermoprotei archaeon]